MTVYVEEPGAASGSYLIHDGDPAELHALAAHIGLSRSDANENLPGAEHYALTAEMGRGAVLAGAVPIDIDRARKIVASNRLRSIPRRPFFAVLREMLGFR